MISFDKPAGPGAKCHSVTIGSTTLYFSFGRLVGFKVTAHPRDERHVADRSYAPTERHLKECGFILTEENLVQNGGNIHHHCFDEAKLQRLALEAIKREN